MLKRLFLAILEVSLILVIVSGCAITGPKIYRTTLRDYVGQRVVRIQTYNKDGAQSGGTGFYVKSPSGKNYILTNRHVCMLEKGEYLRLLDKDNVPIAAKLETIEMSKTSDLCLLKPVHSITGLTVADSVELGETIHYVGYPRLQPMTMTSGEMVGYESKMINIGQIGKSISKENCEYGKDMKIRKVPASYFKDDDEESIEYRQRDDGFPNVVKAPTVDACFEVGNAMTTTLMIYGGASGSPTVNALGQVVGVVYAAPKGGGWGFAVPLSDVRAILKGK